MAVTLNQAALPYALGVGAAFVGSCGIAYKYSSSYVRIPAIGAAFAAVGAAVELVNAYMTYKNKSDLGAETQVESFRANVGKHMQECAGFCVAVFTVVALVVIVAKGVFQGCKRTFFPTLQQQIEKMQLNLERAKAERNFWAKLNVQFLNNRMNQVILQGEAKLAVLRASLGAE